MYIDLGIAVVGALITLGFWIYGKSLERKRVDLDPTGYEWRKTSREISLVVDWLLGVPVATLMVIACHHITLEDIEITRQFLAPRVVIVDQR